MGYKTNYLKICFKSIQTKIKISINSLLNDKMKDIILYTHIIMIVHITVKISYH